MTVGEYGDSGACCARGLYEFRFTFQTATRLRSRAAARGELLVCLPLVRGSGAPKGACITSRGVSPGSPGNRGARQRLFGAPPRRLRTLVRASGDVAPGDFAPLACPRPASLSGRPLSGPDGYPGPPETVLARHVPRRRISLQGCPFRPALALSHFRIASRSAPSLDRTRAG